MICRSIILLLIFSLFSFNSHAEGDYYNKTIGGNIYGSIQLVDPLPVVDLGIGGGMFFDYRFNQRFSIMLESFFTTQDGKGRSSGEGSIEFLAIPVTTFKVYILSDSQRLEPYFGLGVGFYALTEGDISNNTGGYGLGAQVEIGVEFNVADNLMVGVGGTYRSVGLITSLSGNANATSYMPFTMFGRIGYRF
ncbi:hypothetical protein BVY03_03815 [bacterium K02(2017)]|nr:hypothetical protein BVY03_03815 [bacterium K02(2017)]